MYRGESKVKQAKPNKAVCVGLAYTLVEYFCDSIDQNERNNRARQHASEASATTRA